MRGSDAFLAVPVGGRVRRRAGADRMGQASMERGLRPAGDGSAAWAGGGRSPPNRAQLILLRPFSNSGTVPIPGL